MASGEFVLDATAFYAGIPFSSNSKFYTTNSVFKEIKHIKRSYGGLEVLIDADKLKVIEPEELFLQQVISIAKKTGDSSRSSSADLSVLALALQIGATLISDDYAVLNIASLLKIPTKSIFTKGITEIRRWIAFCKTCGKAYDPKITECALCGNRLRHRYKKSWGMKVK